MRDNVCEDLRNEKPGTSKDITDVLWEVVSMGIALYRLLGRRRVQPGKPFMIAVCRCADCGSIFIESIGMEKLHHLCGGCAEKKKEERRLLNELPNHYAPENKCI